MRSQIEPEEARPTFFSDSHAFTLVRVVFALAFLYAIVLPYLVGNNASSRPHRASDKSALPAAHQTAYDGSASCRAADNLCRIVMTFVVRILLPLRFPMLLLGLGKRTRGE
jgi:hypothetical protein